MDYGVQEVGSRPVSVHAYHAFSCKAGIHLQSVRPSVFRSQRAGNKPAWPYGIEEHVMYARARLMKRPVQAQGAWVIEMEIGLDETS